MTRTLLQNEYIEQDQEDLVTVSTTFINQKSRKFPSRPIALGSVAQTSVKDMSVKTENYYFPAILSYLSNVFLPLQPRQFITIGKQDEELISDYILVSAPASSITASAGVKRGKFLPFSINCLTTHLPKSQSKRQDSGLEEEEEEAIWRGVFPLSNSIKIIFSEDIEIKTDELPAWSPNVIIDSYRLEDDEE
jgi:hypothetical protein